MKSLCFFLVFFCLFLFSCIKEDVNSTTISSTLTGEWRWVLSSGGIGGTTITPTAVGYERKLALTADFKFSRYKGTVLEKSDTYEISKEKSIYQTELIDFIKFSDKTSSVIITQTTDELSLADNNFDGFSEIYQRIKK